jgi:HTH-type transcriptional regulator, sugar sensing transcriptional regulator
MDYRELSNLGLSEKEAKVYLAALELGKSPVQKISQKAGVNRATTYVIIEGMMKKGLMSSYHEDKKQFFFAEAPEKLKILFKDQELALKRKEEYLEKLLPELKAINISKEDRPTVRYFEGKEGLRAMSEEFILTKHNEPAKMIYSVDLLSDVFSADEKAMMRNRRLAKKIQVRSLVNDEQGKHDPNSDLTKHIKIPFSKYPVFSDIALFGDKVRIATQKGNLLGMIIENKEIADTLKTLFDLAWESAKNISKKKGPERK